MGWQEIATAAKCDNEKALKRAVMENRDLVAKIDTLEATKQALQREAGLRVATTATARAEFDRAVKEMQAEKEALQIKLAKGLGEVDQEKLDLGYRITRLEFEMGVKEREADEWQEVAMETKKSADGARQKSAKIVQDLEAQVFSLKAAKASSNSDSAGRIHEFEMQRASLTKELQERTKALDEMEREAQEWQEVAMAEKKDAEENMLEMERRFSHCEAEKVKLRSEIAGLR